MVTYADIEKARVNLSGTIYKTSLIQSQTFSSISGNEIYLKTENFQKTGSFKIRGAYNKIVTLTDQEKSKGVIAASAGNHAQGVAFAAAKHGIRSIIVMPESTPVAKVTATKEYGASVILHGSVYDDAYKKAMDIRNNHNMVLIHAFNDPHIIAGQGTIGIEMLEDVKELDMIIVPVGGGGLISGIATAAKNIKPDIKVIGVQTSLYDAMKKSCSEGILTSVSPSASTGSTNTIADGIAVKKPGDRTFPIIQKYVDDIVTVTEEEIAAAILMLLERSKMIVEGAGAVALAAIMDKKVLAKNKKLGIVVSGGNIDINLVSTIIHKGLVKSGRKVELSTILKDKPGQLRDLLGLLAEAKVNIISVNHNRDKEGIDLGYAEVNMVLETQNREHAEKLFEVLKRKGYIVNI